MKQLQESIPVAHTRIYALGAARGNQVVTNDDIAGPIDSSDEWIRQRTGVATRTRAAEDQSMMDLAVEASKEAIAKSGVDPNEIGAVILATISFPYQTPSGASLLSELVGAHDAAAYDISAACAGYCYGIAQADALVRSGLCKYVLVVGAEKLSDFISPTDRTISFLLGDGAGAAIVGASDHPGISRTIWGADGSSWDKVGKTPWPTLTQEGQTVFRWAVWEMSKVAKQALDAAGIEASDLSALVMHQANLRIIDEFAKQMKLPDTVVIAKDIVETGNTSAASVPLAMHRILEEKKVASGGFALQIGFGAGLTFAAQVVELP
jgi:3-oxoacyl-[acyl-carrier-protein] synthase-3